MTHIAESLRALVRERAQFRCEYCLIHEDDTFLPHEIDHIIAEKHGGATTDNNLCLSCFFCNRYKGTDVASFDPVEGTLTALFNPRTMLWQTHFHMTDSNILGMTSTGRTTVILLRFNLPERVMEREPLIKSGRYRA